MKLTIQLRTMTALERGPNLRIRVNKQLLHKVDNLQQDTNIDLEFEPVLANNLVIEHWGKNPKPVSYTHLTLPTTD